MSAADSLKSLGNEAFSNREYKKAAKIYRDALALDFNQILLSNRAMCFIKLEDWDRATKDCLEALKIEPKAELKIQVKLLYRLGLAYEGKGLPFKAEESFEMSLALDPKNTAASAKLIEVQQQIRSSKITDVPIEVVDTLPQEFRDLLSPPTPVPSKAANKEIEELFPNSHKPTPQKKSAPPISSDSEKPTMHYLSSLSSLPDEQKQNAYKFVLDFPASEYVDLFGKVGVDSAFLPFLFEATAKCSTGNIMTDCLPKFLNILNSLHSLPRYDLALSFCDMDHVGLILAISGDSYQGIQFRECISLIEPVLEKYLNEKSSKNL